MQIFWNRFSPSLTMALPFDLSRFPAFGFVHALAWTMTGIGAWRQSLFVPPSPPDAFALHG
jgi:hypothetical protein